MPFRKGGLADSFREKRGLRQARRAHSRTAKSPLRYFFTWDR